MGLYFQCIVCGKKTFGNYNTERRGILRNDKPLCRECAESNALIETVQSQNGAEDACDKCLKNVGSFELGSEKLCHPCFEIQYGKIHLAATSAEYHGGHKAYLAGGYFSKFQLGKMYLTDNHFIFLKSDKDVSKRWKIIIPLKSVIMERWGIEEESRRKDISGAGVAIGDTGIALGGGAIHESGKAHHIVIPYIDENGVSQEPRFGVSSLGGKAIREWSAKLYELIVKTRKNYPQTTSNEQQTGASKTKDDDPLHVLKLRLAKGEITKEEFEDLQKMLE